MMKSLFTCCYLLAISISLRAQPAPVAENVILITFDGLRWQEVFEGMDSVLACDKAFNQRDSARIFQKYWSADPRERRKKLLPFFWSLLEKEGRLFGNRHLGNKVDNANPYWFSYPGYSEIFCGYVDTAVNSNSHPPNPNTNVFEFIHRQKGFKGKVAAFGAWNTFDRILNEQRSGFPVFCGYEDYGGSNPSPLERMINDLKRDAYAPFGQAEPLDVFPFYAAFEYLKVHRPRLLFIGLGETDEWAHHGHYRDYLDAARQTDQWIGAIWNWIQSDPQYRDKTTLLITTDHGRGDLVKAEWTSHGQRVRDSHEMWIAALGPGVKPGGEMRHESQLYQKQVAQTLAECLGLHFTAEHPVAEGLRDALSH